MFHIQYTSKILLQTKHEQLLKQHKEIKVFVIHDFVNKILCLNKQFRFHTKKKAMRKIPAYYFFKIEILYFFRK